MRKTMIVAMARKLMIALWKFLTLGVVPEGAVVKSCLKRCFGATTATAVRDGKGWAWTGVPQGFDAVKKMGPVLQWPLCGLYPVPTRYEVVWTGAAWAKEADPKIPSRGAQRAVNELDRKRLI